MIIKKSYMKKNPPSDFKYFGFCTVTFLFLLQELPLAITTNEINNTNIKLRFMVLKS